MILETLKDAWKVPSIRKKIGFTLLMLLIFRIGSHIPIPFMDREVLQNMMGSGGLFDFFNTFSGGSLKRFSVFSLSIMPYITASIIIQLLTVVIPYLERLSKEGDQGRKKIVQYTRYGTVVLGFINGFGLTIGLRGALTIPQESLRILIYIMIAIVLTAGTAFLMWLGEQITEKGIGNGISLIIFAGIVAGIPDAIKYLVGLLQVGEIGWISIVGLVVIAALIIAAVVFIQEGQRRIPVQYAKRVVGRKQYGGQSSHIPLKVNQAGVIPIIFGISLMAFPATIATWLPQDSAFALFAQKWLQMNGSAYSIPYLIMYALLIIFFTYFYTGITFNPVDVADNLKKYGGFIPGIRPGRPTSDYLFKILSRVTLAGGIFLALIAVLPSLIMGFTGIDNIYLGGTSLLIVVSVALDTMKQMENQLMQRHYQGFLK
ncbi:MULTISPECIES: preprotein translocase subunit SecY [Dehalobacter]|uniref:Protein translocase subunit SecY n=1 Tax=Dehalobacter restrictus TaxID=55583 RepID=A0A857DGN8_9FIRM|nr:MULTISPECIES: preprotein translocase subunit SecY [Dehalobacter]AFV02894.1 Preprotein translocase secY subunit [Dehalobacter sp. DCA]AFV05881.1 Preprotein translocase secY subunit [Dehalobacter sp. CF]EQB22595.1 Preprotein translocase secY subunit [Dehalobacter sp. UNSWDHB]MCG1024422.1 preprotein translocase subunit SecY [Dehalobacter sp.]MCM1564839.1 preprotein translocase subunit SecY [Dehalobacter sp.]